MKGGDGRDGCIKQSDKREVKIHPNCKETIQVYRGKISQGPPFLRERGTKRVTSTLFTIDIQCGKVFFYGE